jgi:hypothetical protein
MPKMKVSQASGILKGALFHGKSISQVTYTLTGDDQRKVHFKDGSSITLQKSEIGALCRQVGAAIYLKKYKDASKAERSKILSFARRRQDTIRNNFLDELEGYKKAMSEVKGSTKAKNLLTGMIKNFKKEKFGTVYENKTTAQDLVAKYRSVEAPNIGMRFTGSSKNRGAWITIRRGGKKLRIPIGKIAAKMK